MNKYLRSLVAIPALIGLVGGSVALPAYAHAQPWGGGAVAGGIIGGMALGAVAGMAMANSPPPPRVVYAPPPPPVYVAPAPYAVVPAAPVYGSYYGGW